MTADMPPVFFDLWFRLICGFMIGAALGSFATMLAYRLPRHMSIVTPDSHCPSCKTRLRPRDLVPMLSWLSARGKCRYCGAAIGARYIRIELTTALACAAATAMMGFTPTLAVVYAGIIVVVVSATGYGTKS